MNKQSELLKKVQDAGYLVELDIDQGRVVWSNTMEYVWAGWDFGAYVWANEGSDEIGWANSPDEVLAMLAGRVTVDGTPSAAPPEADAAPSHEPENDFERGLHDAAKAAGFDATYDTFGYAVYEGGGCITAFAADSAAEQGGFRLLAPPGHNWPTGPRMWVTDVAHAARALQHLACTKPPLPAPTPVLGIPGRSYTLVDLGEAMQQAGFEITYNLSGDLYWAAGLNMVVCSDLLWPNHGYALGVLPYTVDEAVAELRNRVDKAGVPLPAPPEAPAPPAAHDPVNHPSHYTSGGIECIDAIVAAMGVDGAIAFCRGNAMKYLWRTGAKDPAKATEDLRKAGWYIAKAVALQEGK